jgi:hypothetical protein
LEACSTTPALTFLIVPDMQISFIPAFSRRSNDCGDTLISDPNWRLLIIWGCIGAIYRDILYGMTSGGAI